MGRRRIARTCFLRQRCRKTTFSYPFTHQNELQHIDRYLEIKNKPPPVQPLLRTSRGLVPEIVQFVLARPNICRWNHFIQKALAPFPQERWQSMFDLPVLSSPSFSLTPNPQSLGWWFVFSWLVHLVENGPMSFLLAWPYWAKTPSTGHQDPNTS